MNQIRTPFQPRAGKLTLAAAFLTGSFAFAGLAAADEPTTEELMAQIKALQTKVEAVQAKEAAETAQKAEANKADAAERAVADAEARAARGPLGIAPMLQDSGEAADDPDPFTAGHNGKFLLQSPDGLFSLNPNFQIQVRHVANFAPADGESGALEDFDAGFEMRRVKIGFKGNAFSKDLTYDIKFAFNRFGATEDTLDADGFDASGDEILLENAFIDYTPDFLLGDNFGRGEGVLGFRIGQYKDPTFYEEAISSSKQLAADRSLVNEELGGGLTFFVQGAGLLYKGENVQALLAYVDGLASANTDYQDPDGTDFRGGISGRVDFFASGQDQDVFEDFTALDTKENSLRVGGGFFADFVDSSNDDVATAVLFTVDAQYETDTGLGLFAAYYGNYFDDGSIDGFNNGLEIQAAQLIGDNGWEVFGRYDVVIFDEDQTDGENTFHEIVAGVNKYFQGHNAKMTIDVGLLPVGNPSSNTGIGYRSADSDEAQLTIRGQFQLLL